MSKPNAEKVVNTPENPVKINSLSSWEKSCFFSPNPNKRPINKHHKILTLNAAMGISD